MGPNWAEPLDTADVDDEQTIDRAGELWAPM